MIGHKSTEEHVDLTDRLRQLEQLDPAKWVAPRRSVEDAPESLQEEPSAVQHLVPSGGRMFVYGSQSEPRYRDATWLRAPRPPAE